ncbi:MAG TPA: class I SAM-dependent methyltransferase [bacterium]|nr:class I SAM-dependent methyltransferase [bacterium]
MENYLSEFYGDFHRRWNKYNFVHHLSGKKKFFAGRFEGRQKILDLGSRDGSLIHSLGAPKERVVCVDVDQAAVNSCQTKGYKTLWLDLNSGRLPFSDNEFDLIIACDILEHLFSPGILMTEISRILAPGGQLIGSIPNAFYWRHRWQMLRGIDLISYIDPTHVRHFSVESLNTEINQVFGNCVITPYGGNFLRWFWPAMFAEDLFFVVKQIRKEKQ